MAIRDMVARRSKYSETSDFIPTPGFATRALFEHVIPKEAIPRPYASLSVWDPAAGRGHMTRVFREMGMGMGCHGTDINPSPENGVGELDFLTCDENGSVDLIVTNPPYTYANDFVEKSMSIANIGVAMLLRVNFLEGQRRYASIFSKTPPTIIGFFSDRIPFKLNTVVRKASKMHFHMWVYWDVRPGAGVRLPPVWIPPTVQKDLEKDEDYDT